MIKGLYERIKTMEEGGEITKKDAAQEGEVSTALPPQSEILPSTEFVKVEKNLASLGFFTPSSKRLRNAQEKSFTITTITDGKRLELKGTIIPSAKYGLPITADQDKWIALCKILNDILQKEGRVTNPISFTSAEILRLLRKHRHSGKNYREVEEWLDVLFSTTIFSEGVVYLASERRRVKDRFRVFERAVSLGKELPDGKTADKNYVWFSDWQLQNINSNHLLPIDLEAYRQLKNHIAKALVPLLQVWLYATREQGVFEKRYDELCQFLNIQQYRYLSLITRTLAPSLDELKQFGYLTDWRVEETSDGENYKIVFYHGEKFHRDRRARLSRKQTSTSVVQHHLDVREPNGLRSSPEAPRERVHQRGVKSESAINEKFLAELVKRGISETHARKILAGVSADQRVIDQLEWGDVQILQSGGKITNPAGFYISLVSGNVIPPPTFETTSQRKAREEQEQRRENERRAQSELETEYYWYCDDEIQHYIAALDPTAVAAVREAKWQELREKHKGLSSEMIDAFADQETKRELGTRAPLLTIEEYKTKREQGTVLLSKLAPEPPPAEEVSAEPAVALPFSEIALNQTPAGTEPDPAPAPEERGAALEQRLDPATHSAIAGEPAIELSQPLPEAASLPAIAEPAIELVSEPPQQEPSAGPIEPRLL